MEQKRQAGNLLAAVVGGEEAPLGNVLDPRGGDGEVDPVVLRVHLLHGLWFTVYGLGLTVLSEKYTKNSTII